MPDFDTYYEASQHLLDQGCFVVVYFSKRDIKMRWMTPDVLKAKGMHSQLTSEDYESRITHLLAYSYELGQR